MTELIQFLMVRSCVMTRTMHAWRKANAYVRSGQHDGRSIGYRGHRQSSMPVHPAGPALGGGVGRPPLRDHLWQGPPLPVTLRLIHPPPKMTQG